METLLLRLMFITTIIQFGISASDIENCRDQACIKKIKKDSHEILKIDWKPIVIFPEEAKRFR
jgi:hypothetical protein